MVFFHCHLERLCDILAHPREHEGLTNGASHYGHFIRTDAVSM
jgi:hypothetical protein